MQARKNHFYAWLMTVSLVCCFVTTKAHSKVEEPTQKPRTDVQAPDAADARSEFLIALKGWLNSTPTVSQSEASPFTIILRPTTFWPPRPADLFDYMLVNHEGTYLINLDIQPMSRSQPYDKLLSVEVLERPTDWMVWKGVLESCRDSDGWSSHERASDDQLLVYFICTDGEYAARQRVVLKPDRKTLEYQGGDPIIESLAVLWRNVDEDSFIEGFKKVEDADKAQEIFNRAKAVCELAESIYNAETDHRLGNSVAMEGKSGS